MGAKVDGLERLAKKLDKMGDTQFVENAVMQALGYAAEGTRNRAISLLDENVYSQPLPPGGSRTGNLKKIHVEPITGREEKGYRVFTLTRYAVYVEFGTGTKGDPSVPHTARPYWTYQLPNGQFVRTSGMKARPFLRPAFNEQKTKCVKQIKTTLKKRLTEIANNGGGGGGD